MHFEPIELLPSPQNCVSASCTEVRQPPTPMVWHKIGCASCLRRNFTLITLFTLAWLGNARPYSARNAHPPRTVGLSAQTTEYGSVSNVHKPWSHACRGDSSVSAASNIKLAVHVAAPWGGTGSTSSASRGASSCLRQAIDLRGGAISSAGELRNGSDVTSAIRTGGDGDGGSGGKIRSFGLVLNKCLTRAASGGIPGAMAGLLQVVTLMWLRTVVNYQCRYGTSMTAAVRELYRQGGVPRFYRGAAFAVLSNPLSRFGMAAANEGALALGDALPGSVSVAFTTWIASLFAGLWRVVLTPLDTCKTVLQVEGAKGFALLMKKVWGGNVSCLYQGATAAAAATAIGYFPWFLTFNFLNGRVRKPSAVGLKLLRNAGIGLVASIASDLCSNSIRVLKTTKQAAAAYDAQVTYRKAAALIIEADGLLGLLGRGLATRILANGLQSMLFTVVWRYLHDKYIVQRSQDFEASSTKNARVTGVAGVRDNVIDAGERGRGKEARRAQAVFGDTLPRRRTHAGTR